MNFKFMQSWYYFLFVVSVIIPLDIYFMFTDKLALGIILIVMQIPWAISFLLKKAEQE